MSSLNLLVSHETQMQTSLPSEYLAITTSSISQRLTNIKSQSADSLSELSQICATCSMAGIKLMNSQTKFCIANSPHFMRCFG